MKKRTIFCCGCQGDVSAVLITGKEVYPHRPDLRSLPFWRCDTCKNFVGCHHKTKDRTNPLGVIPTPEMKAARQHIHRILDPMWKSGEHNRGALYAKIAEAMGIEVYHTADLRSVEDARKAYAVIVKIKAPAGAS